MTGVETTLLVGGNFGEDVASATGGTQLGPGGSPQFSPIYLGPNDGADVAIATVATPLPAGVLKKLFIQVDFSPGSSSESDFFSVCVNGDCVGPGISCTVIAAQTECNDPADTATINDGDTVAIRAATHSGSAHFTNVTWSLEYQH
ncbi:MAG TPA: hypothetical protein VMV27_09230 [Candidatus Binataceae bacterium]|nr:hypothetical protein [Candidatus Binataceae bacterium]